MKNLQQLRAAREGGFTLIELIIVIVIIGILAAVAIPKFTDLTADAKLSAVKGIAGNIASAAGVNYAVRSASALDASSKRTKGVAVTTCDATTAQSLVNGFSTSSYTIAATSGKTSGTTDGSELYCTITDATDTNVKVDVVLTYVK